jgi:hypothetical protein
LQVLVFIVVAGIAVYKLLPNLDHEVNGYSFEETLQRATKAAGEDAHVLTFLVRGQDYSYALVTSHGDVLERFYGELCTNSSKGHNCVNSESHHSHPASARETERAQVRLADIDPRILGELRHETGAGEIDPIALRRRQWIIVPTKAVPFIADADGSNLHHATTPEELALAESVVRAPDTR